MYEFGERDGEVVVLFVELALGAQYDVELPIATQMAEVLAGRTDVRTAVDALMIRRQRPESESG